MADTTTFNLDEHVMAFVEAQIESGRYGSASEVVRAGLRLLEDRETKLAALRDALVEGEKSGLSEQFDFEAFIAKKRGTTAPAS